MSEGEQSPGAGPLVGRCYTRAKRLPVVIGEWGGTPLWGGPYSVPQLITMVVVLAVMLLLHPLWAHYGVFNVVPLVVVPYVVSFFVRYLPTGSRNPLAVVASVVSLVFAPSQGRVAGRQLTHRRRPVLLTGACTLTWQPAPARPVGGARPAAVRQLAATRPGRPPEPARVAASASASVPAAAAASGRRAVAPVWASLARDVGSARNNQS
ncbi:hypothetical protein DSC45_34565 [Streptomyces sp. YIM 130001]|uniref:hypothetical protein n=1 Tax=Streptomyces sp. YIM 130001 TaxID=2259644 RepID=UPI000EEBF623|nr:hypothetical protein [Streptomyces sp. YIM 130001]RII06953.1 hypothetical protein DSC45_34565 [Streptomyces sp. YIM 130001]